MKAMFKFLSPLWDNLGVMMFAEGEAAAGAVAESAEGSQAAGAVAEGTAAGGADKPWYEALPEDIRFVEDKDTKEKKVNPTLEKFKDIPSLAKSYLEAQKVISSKGVILPNLKDPKDVERFHTEMSKAGLGRPETPEGYKFTDPQGLREDIAKQNALDKPFAQWAHKAGLTQAQAQELRAAYRALEQDTIVAQEKAIEDQRVEAVKALQAKYGDNLGKYNEQAKKFIYQIPGGKEMMEKLGKMGLADNPEFLPILYEMSKQFSEESIKNFGFSTLTGGLAEAQTSYAKFKEAIADPMKFKDHPINSENSVTRAAAAKERSRLAQFIIDNGGVL